MKSEYRDSEVELILLLYLTTCYDQLRIRTGIGSDPIIIGLTLFVFSSIQGRFQNELSESYYICVGTSSCTNLQFCYHRYKSYSWITKFWRVTMALLNTIVINYILIAFLEDALGKAKGYRDKWKSLNYIGHHICLGYFLLGIYIFSRSIDSAGPAGTNTPPPPPPPPSSLPHKMTTTISLKPAPVGVRHISTIQAVDSRIIAERHLHHPPQQK